MKTIKVLLTGLLTCIAFFALAQNQALVLLESKWPTHDINVSWINPKPENSTQRQLVQNAVDDTWVKNSGLKLHWIDNANNIHGIRIEISDEWPHTNHLGRFCDNQPVGMVLNFTFKNWKPIAEITDAQIKSLYAKFLTMIAVHEFGHALGFAHEQNRAGCPQCDMPSQGDFGDWGTPDCDPYSVMNYCNHNMNNGILSDGDIQGVQALYGMPDDKSITNAPKLTFLHSVVNTGVGQNGASNVNVFLSGMNGELNLIDSVTYDFGQNFAKQSLTSSNGGNKFAIQVKANDSTNFPLTATISYKNGEKKKVSTYINLAVAKAGDLPDTSIKVIYTIKNRFLRRLKYRFGFSIDTNSAVYKKIVRVEYTRDHPTFPYKTIRSENQVDGFYVGWIGYGCIEHVRIKIFYVENNELFYKKIDYNQCTHSGWTNQEQEKKVEQQTAE